jgi:hypothetical protein
VTAIRALITATSTRSRVLMRGSVASLVRPPPLQREAHPASDSAAPANPLSARLCLGFVFQARRHRLAAPD